MEAVLPLFPLPLVLFPGTLIPLHIFEDRYRRMISDVREGEGRFGIIYHDPDESGPFLNEKGQVGTVAEIRRYQGLPDGRSLILIRGVERFRIVRELRADTPYYQARVEPYHDRGIPDQDSLLTRRERTLDLFNQALARLPEGQEELPSFRADEELAFKVAAAIRMDAPGKQALLELKDEEERLQRLDPILRMAGGEEWMGGRAQA